MVKRLLIDALHAEEMRVVIADNTTISDFDFVNVGKKQVKGNVYLAKVTRVEPSLQAAFVEYGGGKQGFLPFSEIHPDYYQLPLADRQRILEEVERELEEDLAAEEALDPASLADAATAEPSLEGTAEARPEALAMPQLTDDTTPELPAVAAEEPLPSISEEAPTPAEAPAENTSDNTVEEIPEAVAASEGVETMMNEVEEASAKRKKRTPFFKRYRIQDVIKRGQIVLIQVIKDERGNKGVSATTYLSLAGRYCVLMPNSPRDGGVSRKISDIGTRRRLKELMEELKLAKGMSVIIRTAGVDRPTAEIRRDFDYLVKLWNHVRDTTLASTAPALIYEENNLIKRSIRDLYTNDIDEVVVQGDAAFEEAKEFMALLLPSHTSKIKNYNEPMPLLYSYGIEDQLLSMYDPVVKLKSGGYIVINPTEALISIDVNSGRSTSERNVEETAAKTNIEAAYEVARQLRLRDLAGLIVVDFIDMMEGRNRRNVERAIKDALRTDRAKIQLGRISPFGLLEMSRQRLRPSITDASMVPCTHCAGRGMIRSDESMVLHLLRTLERDASTGNFAEFRVTMPQSLALYLLNHKREIVSALEARHSVSISILINLNSEGFEFTIDKVKRAGARRERDRDRERGRYERDRSDTAEVTDVVEAPVDGEAKTEETPAREGRERTRNRRPRGGRGRGKREFEPRDPSEASPDAVDAEAPSAEGETREPKEAREPREPREPRERGERGPRTRTRGGRGRRRWREGDAPETTAESPAAEPTSAPQPAAASAEVYDLPAFTRSSVRDTSPTPPAPEPAPLPEVSARPEGAPPKRGWWQKMIELD